MEVLVKRGNVFYCCKSEEQLKLFIDAGYEKVEKLEPVEEEKPKKRTKKQ